MNKKLKIFLSVIFISLFLIQSTNAFIVYLRPPKMTIRLNTTDTVERSLEIMNKNNVSMDISTIVKGNISSIINIKNPRFILEPNGTMMLDFDVNSYNPGLYTGEIWVNYTSNISVPILVPAEITIFVRKNPNSEKNNDFTPFTIAIVILIIITILLVVKVRKK